MSQLKIIKASAGSGKTFSLAGAYLRLVITEPSDYFRHILAVTFTNKATVEMKDRIISELNRLAYGQKSDHLSFLLKSTKMTEEAIRSKALIVMEHILHGYSWFRVETIDSFFQSIIRNFIRELNIPGFYSIELDQEKVLTEALERFLDTIGENTKVTDWLIEYIESRINAGKSWDIEKGLTKLGFHLFKEEIIDNLPAIQPFIEDVGKMKNYSDTLLAIIKSFESKMVKEAKSALDAMKNQGFVDTDFFYSGSGTISYLRKIVKKAFELPSSRFQTLIENPSKWPSKDCARKPEAEKLGTDILNRSAERITAIFQAENHHYQTSLAIYRNLHLLGMLSSLSKHLVDLKSEKDIFLISDASPFIRRIINNNDAPFIYEKAGNNFYHLLIDEFQDTSKMQWDNFKPLISNSLSFGHECLLVGDVKQAIYRWRNSKWEIMAKQVKTDFADENIYERSLEINWRSDARIIRFNNLLFKHIPEISQEAFSFAVNQENRITDIYKEVIQDIPDWKKLKNDGYINLRILKKGKETEGNEEVVQELLLRINEILAGGFLPGDIAILVRDKKEGTEISDILIKANKEKAFSVDVGVISNESLFLRQSPAVNMLVSALQFVFDPNDKLNAASLLASYLQVHTSQPNIGKAFSNGKFHSSLLNTFILEDFTRICSGLKNEGLYNLVEKLSKLLDLNSLTEEKIYLHSFLDMVFNYSTRELPDIKSFIDYWKDEGMNRSISCSETPGSIRILTIHKSKGLEFPVVILPFADWSLSPKANEIQWVVPKESPFNELPLVPVNYSQTLSDSEFSVEYETEKYQTLIDNINLLYVALTRAENVLVAIVQQSKDGIKNAGDLLVHAIQKIRDTNEMEELVFHADENRYTMGMPMNSQQNIQSQNSKDIASDESDFNIPDIRLSNQLYPVSSKAKTNSVFYGKMLHAILEKVKVVADIPNAIQYFQLSGTISKDDAGEIESVLMKALANTKVADWFDAKNKILTESEIIGTTGQTKRPDRVIIKSDKTMVVDYKFGDREQIDSHRKQVGGYMKLIKDMGFKTVEGYIWYVLEDEISEVIE